MSLPPRDTVFIALMKGYPWPVQTVYSPAEDKWVVATVQASMVDGKYDIYFENEWYDLDDMVEWWKMPKYEVR